MSQVIDIYGVYLPSLLVLGLVAYGLNRLVSRGLARVGFYRLVWHKALFDVALYVVLFGLLFLLLQGSWQ